MFYGLAKAAGDSTQASSSNAVGTYTSEAKAAIKSMLGVSEPVDVQINGTSIIQNGIANVPIATSTTPGVVKVTDYTYGLVMLSDGNISVYNANANQVKAGTETSRPIVPARQDASAFYGLAKAAGDTTQSSSSNAVGIYTDSAKAAIQTMLGIESGVMFIENVSGATPSITGEPNTRYMCGEVSSISIAAPANGIIDVVFASGTTAAMLTVTPPAGKTMVWPAWFDPDNLNPSATYEINIMDGIYGGVMIWQ